MNTQLLRRVALSAALCLFVVFDMVGSAVAQNRTWHPPISGNWVIQEHWSPMGTPQPDENAHITLNGSFQVTLEEDTSIRSLRIGAPGGEQWLTLKGAALSVSEPSWVLSGGHLLLNNSSTRGPIENLAWIGMQSSELSQLTSNRGTVVALGGQNSISEFPAQHRGTVQVGGQGTTTELAIEQPIGADQINHSGLIEIAGRNDSTATLNFGDFPLHIEPNGIVRFTGGTDAAFLVAEEIRNEGTIEGSGTIIGNVINGSMLNVGNSAGLLRVEGNFTQDANAMLSVELGGYEPGSEFDVIEVTGNANLSGELFVQVMDHLELQDGDSFEIITRDGGSGEFATRVGGGEGLAYDVDYKDEVVMLRFSGPDHVLKGDYNGNGIVDQPDLDLILLNWGNVGPAPVGWVNDLPDDRIDQNELDRILLGWGQTAPAGIAAASIPEPASLLVAALALLGLIPVVLRRNR